MKTSLVKLLIDAKGRINSLVVGVVVGYATKFMADRNLSLDPLVEDLLASTVGLGVMWAIDSIVLHLQTKGVKEIQNALPNHVRTDGVPGTVTVDAVKEIVTENKNTTP